MDSFYNSVYNTLSGLVASCMPATRNTVEELVSYYTLIPGSAFDIDIVITKVLKEKPTLDVGLAAGVAAAIGTCCVAVASVGLFAYKKYGNLRKLLEQTENDFERQKDDRDDENRKLKEILEAKDRSLREAEERWTKLTEEHAEEIQKRDDMMNKLEIDKQDIDEELRNALRHGKEMEALLEDSRARELEMKSSLLSLEERLQQRETQIEDMLCVGQRLKLEQQELARQIEQDDKQMQSLLAELKDKENNLKDYFEGEIKKNDDVIACLKNKLEDTVHQRNEMETSLEEARTREEEKLQQWDRQLKDLLRVEQSLREERERLIEKLEEKNKETESLLERSNRLQNELESCFSFLDESKDRMIYFEGEIQKKDKVIENLHEKLEVALQREKDMESFLIEAKRNERDANLFKEQLENRNTQVKDLLLEVERLKDENQVLEQKWANALRDAELEQQLLRQRAEEHVEISLYWQQKFEEADKEVREMKSNVKLAEDQLKETTLFIKEKEEEHNDVKMQYQEELKEKDDEIERLLEMVRNMLKAQERAREQQRINEQMLRKEDKYMLMTVLHGIAERNFHLEHIALEYGNENQQNIPEEEKQGKERDEDLFDYMQKRKAEQYDRAQQERNVYFKQWGDLTQMLQELMCGDENLPELRNAVSGQISKNEAHRFKNRPNEIQILKDRIAHLEGENLILLEQRVGKLQKEFDELSCQIKDTKDLLREVEDKLAEYLLMQKNTQMETLDRRAVLKSEADQCIHNEKRRISPQKKIGRRKTRQKRALDPIPPRKGKHPEGKLGRQEHNRSPKRKYKDQDHLIRRRQAAMRDLELQLAQLPDIPPNLYLTGHLYGHLWALKHSPAEQLDSLINEFNRCYCQNNKEPSFGQKQVNKLMKDRLLLWRALKAAIKDEEQKPEYEGLTNHLTNHLEKLEAATLENLKIVLKRTVLCGCWDYFHLDLIKPRFFDIKLKKLVQHRDALISDLRQHVANMDQDPDNARLIRHIMGHVGNLRLATTKDLQPEIEKVEKCNCHLALRKKGKKFRKSIPHPWNPKWKKVFSMRNHLVRNILAQMEDLRVHNDVKMIQHLEKHIKDLLLAKPGQIPGVIVGVLLCFCQAASPAENYEFQDWEEYFYYPFWLQGSEAFSSTKESVPTSPTASEASSSVTLEKEESEPTISIGPKEIDSEASSSSWKKKERGPTSSFRSKKEEREPSSSTSLKKTETLGLSSTASSIEKESVASGAEKSLGLSTDLTIESLNRELIVLTQKLASMTNMLIEAINKEKDLSEKVDMITELVREIIDKEKKDSMEKMEMQEIEMARNKLKSELEALYLDKKALAKEREDLDRELEALYLDKKALAKEREDLDRERREFSNFLDAFVRWEKGFEKALNNVHLTKKSCSKESKNRFNLEEELTMRQRLICESLMARILSEWARDKLKLQEYEKLILGKIPNEEYHTPSMCARWER